MKINKNLLRLLGSLSIFVLSGCASVPNVPVCVELQENVEGFCKNTIDAKETIVNNVDSLLNGKTWVQVKTGSLLVPAQSWGEIKEYILKQCKKSKECNDNIGEWTKHIERLEKQLKSGEVK